ncbi:MAG: ribonuclease HII [Luteolibacter sp.]
MPDMTFEKALRKRGLLLIAGVDEAGRGPLAGPVSAAAVILPNSFHCEGLDDSKKISKTKRDILFQQITENKHVSWHQAFATVEEIHELNILRATHLAMRRALDGLREKPDHCLIDGLPIKNFHYPHDGIVKGDGKSLSIAAASIIAKVSRDRHMERLDREFPQYGFARHQGYGTKEHLENLRIHGACRHHRQTFQPVAQLTLSSGDA